jgi:predicted transport protein
MNKIKWIVLGTFMVLLVAGGWFVYSKMTDDTYEGMSIIPEQHDDIPLIEGMEPTRTHYIIEGDRWKDVYDFYLKKLPELGWENRYNQSALEDQDTENDWGGFITRWTKKGFEGELSISASFNKFDDQTKVMFDQNPIYHSSTWIDEVPESICVYKASTNQDCILIKDKAKILKIAETINEAIDWNEKALTRKKVSIVDFGDSSINVLNEKDKGIYIESEKGLKFMKPEPEFLELLDLSEK